MPSTPLASIIITSYNYAPYLGAAIDSALNQTYPATEVVVVDDGSADESPAIIAGYGASVRSLLRPHEGPIPAIHAAFGASRGEILIFLDSDDLLLPTALERAIFALEDPGSVKAHWPLREINAQGVATGRLIPTEPLLDGLLLERLVVEGPDSCGSPPMSGNAWRRALLEQLLPIPQDEGPVHSDSYMTTLAPVYGAIRTLPEPLGCYRVHGRNDFACRSAVERTRRNLATYPHRCSSLRKHLRKRGIPVDAERWKRGNACYDWMTSMVAAGELLESLTCRGESFILVDDGQWADHWGGGDVIEGRKAIPFLEKGGAYWGAPEDDQTAIREFERVRSSGASLIVFGWPAFWWLEYYSAFAQYLYSQFPRIAATDEVVVFDLRCGTGLGPRQLEPPA